MAKVTSEFNVHLTKAQKAKLIKLADKYETKDFQNNDLLSSCKFRRPDLHLPL